MKRIRKIIKIDEEKCNGCGLCIPQCPEGALQIVDGKAKLVSEIYCDGLGACIGVCPQGAITIEEREAEEFDEEAVKRRLKELGREEHIHAHQPIQWKTDKEGQLGEHVGSALSQWPIQLMLVHPQAPYFQDRDLILTADCVPFAYANFHQDFLRGKAIAIACPKLDDIQYYEEKLTDLFSRSNIKSVTVINMEVPCCHGLYFVTQKALQNSGKNIPLKQVIIGIKGDRIK